MSLTPTVPSVEALEEIAQADDLACPAAAQAVGVRGWLALARHGVRSGRRCGEPVTHAWVGYCTVGDTRHDHEGRFCARHTALFVAESRRRGIGCAHHPATVWLTAWWPI